MCAGPDPTEHGERVQCARLVSHGRHVAHSPPGHVARARGGVSYTRLDVSSIPWSSWLLLSWNIWRAKPQKYFSKEFFATESQGARAHRRRPSLRVGHVERQDGTRLSPIPNTPAPTPIRSRRRPNEPPSSPPLLPRRRSECSPRVAAPPRRPYTVCGVALRRAGRGIANDTATMMGEAGVVVVVCAPRRARRSRGTAPSTSRPPRWTYPCAWRSRSPGLCRSYPPGSKSSTRWRRRGPRRTRRGAWRASR